MKAFVIVMCTVLMCLGCGAAPETNTNEVTGTTRPDPNPGAGLPNGGEFNACAAGWRYVTVWVNGQPVPEWQPVICNQVPNPDTGDPMMKFKGDPDPTNQNPGVPVQTNAPTPEQNQQH